MHFFFASVQVISSLNSTYILWYPRGENQLPLPLNRQRGCTRNFCGHTLSEPLTWAVGCRGMSSTWWWPVESGDSTRHSLLCLLGNVNVTAQTPSVTQQTPSCNTAPFCTSAAAVTDPAPTALLCHFQTVRWSRNAFKIQRFRTVTLYYKKFITSQTWRAAYKSDTAGSETLKTYCHIYRVYAF